jgi:hypothetical protein
MPEYERLGEPGALVGTRAHSAKTWGRCSLCLHDIVPGTKIALPAGYSQYAHVSCIARASAPSG